MLKEEILYQLSEGSKAFSLFCSGIDDLAFFSQPESKWSIAQNVTHLITAADNTRLAFSLPKFLLKWYAGEPNRPSRSYDELVAKYKLKLGQGGRAAGRFIPKPVPASAGKEKTIAHFSNAMKRLSSALLKNWKDHQLDLYIAPHPLLGKITLRELCYFTIYHTQHHLQIIKERAGE